MHVLLIEDNEDDACLIGETLTERTAADVELEWVDRLENGLTRLAEDKVDLVLLDLSLPDSHGLETLDKVQRQTPDVPVIVLTHLDDEAMAVQAVRRGAQDYLVKGRSDGDGLARAIKYAIERKGWDKAVRDSEARLRAMIDTALDALIGINAKGMITEWNPRAEVIFGWARREAIGQKLADLIIPPRYRGAHERGLRHFLRTGEGTVINRRVELTGLRRDGTEFPVELSISPLKRGETYVFNAFLSDITERKRAEEIRVRLASIVESSEDAILSKTLDGIVTSWNRGAERTFGYTADEAIGKPIGLLIPHDRLDEESQIIERVKQGEHVTHFETVRRRKDGTELNIALTISPIKDGEGRAMGFSEIARDITEQKGLEAQLRQSQKMEGVGQLAGGIAHDFNNLLTVINSYSAMVLGELDFSNPFVRNGIEQIKEAGHRAASLTRQLLMFSRQQVLEPKVLNLNEVVSNIAKLLRRLIGEDITQVLCLHPALGRVKIDPGQLEQIVMNLAVNARDAMPGGGQLTIETENVELDNAYVRTHALVQPGPYVMLAVSDTGCGMDADTQARIFEPFFTTKGPGKGTGLGLATVDGIVKQSGGNIWVYSELRKGTTLKIYLPRVEQTSEVPEPGAAPVELPRGSETVLLVEDEEMAEPSGAVRCQQA